MTSYQVSSSFLFYWFKFLSNLLKWCYLWLLRPDCRDYELAVANTILITCLHLKLTPLYGNVEPCCLPLFLCSVKITSNLKKHFKFTLQPDQLEISFGTPVIPPAKIKLNNKVWYFQLKRSLFKSAASGERCPVPVSTPGKRMVFSIHRLHWAHGESCCDHIIV